VLCACYVLSGVACCGFEVDRCVGGVRCVGAGVCVSFYALLLCRVVGLVVSDASFVALMFC
jgi:hypothetical protein